MKFLTYDELIKYLSDKELSSLEFEIKELPATDCPTGDCSVIPNIAANPPVPQNEQVAVTFASFYDKPEILFESSTESVLVVEEYTSIPNACSTTKINLGDREITIGICEAEDGQATAKFDIIVNGKSYFGKRFKIVSDSEKYKNTINLND